MKNRFWKWLALYAFKKIRYDKEALKIGVPGIRDVDHRCESYCPGQCGTLRSFAECEGDGHYLCKTCRFHKTADSCKECGSEVDIILLCGHTYLCRTCWEKVINSKTS